MRKDRLAAQTAGVNSSVHTQLVQDGSMRAPQQGQLRCRRLLRCWRARSGRRGRPALQLARQRKRLSVTAKRKVPQSTGATVSGSTEASRCTSPGPPRAAPNSLPPAPREAAWSVSMGSNLSLPSHWIAESLTQSGQWRIGSGPLARGIWSVSHFFARCSVTVARVKNTRPCESLTRNKKKHGNARIVCKTRAILAWQCVVLLAQRAKQCYKIWYLWPCWCSSERQNKEYCKESVRDRQAGSGLWHRIYSIVVQQHCFIQLHAGRNSLRCWLVCCPMIFTCCYCCLVTVKTI